MTPLDYLPSFEDDVLAIWLRIAEANPPAADRMVDRIQERVLMLSEHPLTTRMPVNHRQPLQRR